MCQGDKGQGVCDVCVVSPPHPVTDPRVAQPPLLGAAPLTSGDPLFMSPACVRVRLWPPAPPAPLSCVAGVNTGVCITGDVDCDGNPSGVGPVLSAADPSAIDNARLDVGEFAVVILDFGRNNTAPQATRRRELAVVGVRVAMSLQSSGVCVLP
jgi:hypothetical protein